MTQSPTALVLHGGAGARRSRDYTREIAHMRGLAEAGRARLNAGACALDVVVETIAALEASGLYVAGRGASPNQSGVYELDASVMVGRDRRAGAVAAFVGFASPITAARAVMETTPHVLLAGDGAAAFAQAQGLEPIADPASWFTPAGRDEANHAPPSPAGLAHGTVGCVALGLDGGLAAGTSTGGVFNKLPGRVGDAPLPGSGVWADDLVAVSCTGQGEYFIRTNAASQVSARMRYQGLDLDAAAAAAIQEIAALGGDGGLIAVDRMGRVATPYNSEGMKRAAVLADGTVVAAAFETPA